MRYIDAEKLIDDIRPFAEYDSNLSNKDWVRRFEIAIDAQPTADVRENVNGNLVNIEPSLMLIDAIPGPSGGALLSMDKACSKCKTPIPPNLCNNVWFKYCPFCGADLSVERTDT